MSGSEDGYAHATASEPDDISPEEAGSDTSEQVVGGVDVTDGLYTSSPDEPDLSDFGGADLSPEQGIDSDGDGVADMSGAGGYADANAFEVR